MNFKQPIKICHIFSPVHSNALIQAMVLLYIQRKKKFHPPRSREMKKKKDGRICRFEMSFCFEKRKINKTNYDNLFARRKLCLLMMKSDSHMYIVEHWIAQGMEKRERCLRQIYSNHDYHIYNNTILIILWSVKTLRPYCSVWGPSPTPPPPPPPSLSYRSLVIARLL